MTTNNSGVKRYELESGYDSTMRKVNRMQESEDGVYVRFYDYEALQADYQRLQAEREKLVEALTELCDEIDKHEIHAAISKTSISWFKRKARKALAAYQQRGGE
jgi:hypothetical protein